MKKFPILIGGAVAAIFLLLSSIYVVDEREQALVLQFGDVKATRTDPGLYFKVPFIQEVAVYDDRILSVDIDAKEITPSDDRRLIVDAFVRYRIADITQFRKAVGAGGIPLANTRVERFVETALRDVLGSVDSAAILSEERVGLMVRIRNTAIAEARALGLEVIDVRIKRADLPEQNLAATFDRMRAERVREATDLRARGAEAAQKVIAGAQRESIEIVSLAERDANIVRGEADARRNSIFAEAYGRDAEFFEFYRSLAAYETALQGQNSSMILSPDGEFFDYFASPNGRPAAE